MTLLASLFDFHRGYPNGSALAWPFLIKKTAGVPATIAAGSIVTQELSGTDTVIDLATTPNTSIADPVSPWLVMEGNDDYSGTFVEKVNAVRLGTGIVWRTDDYAAGTYTPGVAVSFSAGQVKVKAANEQIIGHVLEDLTATVGVVVIADY